MACDGNDHGHAAEQPDHALKGAEMKATITSVSVPESEMKTTITSVSVPESEMKPTITSVSVPESEMKANMTSVSVSDFVRRVSTFSDPALLRGVPLFTVMWCGAQLYASKIGSGETFNLSRVVNSIDAFISHNWDTNRWDKFLALAVHYNTQAACCAFAIVAVPLGVLVMLGILPLSERISETTGEVFFASIWCTVFCYPCLLLTLFFRHDVAALLGKPGRLVFLDKVCIHQTDPVQKQAGIEALAAFLANSRNLIILFTELYLKKLWTVYELATALTLANDMKIAVLPLILIRFKLLLSGAVWVLLVVTRTTTFIRIEVAGSINVMSFPIIFFFAGRFIEAKQRRMRDILRAFDLRTAKCYAESDRAVVVNNVAAFMREKGFVAFQASEDEVVDTFNEVVRQRLPAAVAMEFRLSDVIFVNIASLAISMDQLLSLLRTSGDVVAMLDIAAAVFWVFVTYPIIAMLSMRLGEKTFDHPIRALLAGPSTVLISFFWFLTAFPRPMAAILGSAGYAVVGVAVVIQCTLMLWLYGVCPRSPAKMQKTEQSQLSSSEPDATIL